MHESNQALYSGSLNGNTLPMPVIPSVSCIGCVSKAHVAASSLALFPTVQGEVKDKSVTVLLPPPFADQMLQKIRNFVTSGEGPEANREQGLVAQSTRIVQTPSFDFTHVPSILKKLPPVLRSLI